MLDNITRAFGLLMAAVGTAGILIPAFRKDSPVRKIPWWWWLTSAAAFLLMGYATERDFWQGALLLAGMFFLGIGGTLFFLGVKAGTIRLRRRRAPSYNEQLALRDWQNGSALVRVLDARATFDLTGGSPYVDITLDLLNVNVHPAYIQREIKGRILVPDEQQTFQELTHGPEFKQYTDEQGGLIGPFPPDELRMFHNERRGVVLRQHLVPEVRDMLAARRGETMLFSLDSLDVGALFGRPSATNPRTEERTNRRRLPLGAYHFTVPR